jgi:hypothetical protein
MRVEYRDHVDHLDFIIPTIEQAEDLIRDGAVNGVDLLEQAGMTPAAAKGRAASMLPGTLVGEDGPPPFDDES